MSGRGLSITNTYVVDVMNSVKSEEERNGVADPEVVQAGPRTVAYLHRVT